MNKLTWAVWSFMFLIATPSFAQDEEDDEEDDEIEFLIIEQPEVVAPGTPGFARVSIGFHKKEANGGKITVKSGDGYEASWEGRPGVRAAFGRRGEGKMTVVLEGPNGTEELDLDIKGLKKKEEKEGVTKLCWLTLRSDKNKTKLKGKCVTEPPPIPLSEASCNAPIAPPSRGLVLLENVGNMLGCIAWRYERASNLALKAQTDMAAALGLKEASDAAKQRMDNLKGVEDVLESQSLRAQAMMDESLIDAIATAAASEQEVSAEALAAIQKADEMRLAANEVAAPIPGKIAEMAAYITATVLVYVADITQEAANAASDPFSAVAAAAKVAVMIAELRPKYIKNVLTPMGKMVKQSGDVYRNADTRLNQALAQFYTAHDATPPDPAQVSVAEFESDAM